MLQLQPHAPRAAPLRPRAPGARAPPCVSRGAVRCTAAAAAPAANRLSAAFAAALARKQCVPAACRVRPPCAPARADASPAHGPPGRPALIPFICAGDPNLATTAAALRALDEARPIQPPRVQRRA